MHVCLNESRIREMERKEAIMGTRLDSLTKELEKLTGAIQTLVWISIPTVIGLLGFLGSYWIKGGQ